VEIQIRRAAENFADWPELLRLLQGAFEYMEGRIDPPSSLQRLTPASIAEKSREEALFLASDDGELIGCVFARPRDGALYVGKLAVRRDQQHNGIGRRLMEAVEDHARDSRVESLELETRIELAENRETFAAMGYVKTAEHAHQGYERTTFITMRKKLTG